MGERKTHRWETTDAIVEAEDGRIVVTTTCQDCGFTLQHRFWSGSFACDAALRYEWGRDQVLEIAGSDEPTADAQRQRYIDHLAQVAYDAIAGHLDTTSPSVWHTSAAAVEEEVVKVQAARCRQVAEFALTRGHRAVASAFEANATFVEGEYWRSAGNE